MYQRILGFFSASFIFLAATSFAFEVKAPQAFLIDFTTGANLYEKNADQLMVPSSMTKIMTVYLAFERLKNKDITLQTQFRVSKEAWQKEGSRMFLQVNSLVTVEDLIKGIVVDSGNDACCVLAEGLSGTEAAFAEEMTKKAHEMGAKNTMFINSTGLPDEKHLTTARDLAIMAERTIKDFPQEYAKYYAMTQYEYNHIKQQNRNSLLKAGIGADGVKTGHTEAGGFGIVGSVKQDGRRLIVVVNGLKSDKEREQEALTLLNWGRTHFKNYKLFAKGQAVVMADVWGGVKKRVALVPKEDIVVTLARANRKALQVKVVYNNPIQAPVKVGQELGFLEISAPDFQMKRIPLYGETSVDQADIFSRLIESLLYLIWGKHKE